VDDDAPASARADDDAEDDTGTIPGPAVGFRERKAVGVVGALDGPVQPATELAFFTRPVAGDRVPGMPTPTGQTCPMSLSMPRTSSAMASTVAR
jgi:hypothetical protein